jgi:Predicted ATPase
VEPGVGLAPFVSPLAVRILVEQPELRRGTIEGTLAFFDISGFTRLSERLARLGKLGAETITLIVDGIYTGLVDAAFRHGGDVIQFSGDALFVHFASEDHAVRAVAGAVEMYDFLSREGRLSTESGPVRLRMSAGMHSGCFDVSLVGGGQLAPLAWGAETTRALQCEKDADAGQVQVSATTASLLPPRWWRAHGSDAARLRLGAINADLPALGAQSAPEDASAIARLVAPALREPLAGGALAGEHRPLTAAFVGVKHHAAYADGYGTEALGAALMEIGAAVDDVCARWNLLWVGADALVDACDFFILTGAPRVAEDDEERITRAMTELVALDVPMRLAIGLNRGRVFAGPVGHPHRQTYGVTGDAVNLAARVMARAEPGELLATKPVLARVHARVASTSMVPFAAKGKRALVETERIDEVTDRRIEPDALPIVGRVEELTLLRSALEAVMQGGGRVVDIVANAGIGKTRLLDAFLAESPVLVARAAANPYARATPYAAIRGPARVMLGISNDVTARDAGAELASVIARSAPELIPWLPLIATVIGAEVPSTPEVDRLAPEFAAERLVRATVEALIAVPRGAGVLVLEDLHWADEASVSVLGGLATRIDEIPWLVCTARRPGPGWTEMATELALGPIDANAALRLVTAAVGEQGITDGVAAAVIARAQGNPLFLRELVAVAGDEDELPETIEQVIGAQIDALPPGLRLQLREAAVVGGSVELALLADAYGEPHLVEPRMWDPLSEFLVTDGVGRLRFRHDLARTTAYEGLGYRRRRELHGALADALRADARADAANFDRAGPIAPLLALHYSEAHRWRDAWEWSRSAAQNAMSQSATAEAFALLGRALDAVAHVADAPAAAVAEAAETRADLALRLGHSEEAHRALRLSRSRRVQDVSGTVRCLRKHGDVAEREGRYGQAMRWQRRALRAGENDSSASVRRESLQARLSYAVALYFQGRLREAIAWCEPVCDEARALDDAAALAQACMQIEGAAAELSPPESRGLADLAERLFREIGDDISLGNLLLNLGIVAFKSSDWGNAAQRYGEAADAFERAGDEIGAALARNNLAELLTDQGHDAQARENLEHARRVFQASAYHYGLALTESGLARLDLRGGARAEAGARLDVAMEVFGALGATALVVDTMVRRVEWHLMTGDPDGALAALAAAERAAATTDQIAILPATIARLRAEATTWLDGPDAGLPLARAAVETARAERSAYEELRSLDVLARIEAAAGLDPAPAARARDRLIEELGVVGLPVVRWDDH